MPGVTLPALKPSSRSPISSAEEVSYIWISDDDSSDIGSNYGTDDATIVNGDEVNGHDDSAKHKLDVDDNSHEHEDIAESGSDADPVNNEMDNGGDDLDVGNNDIRDNDIDAGNSVMDINVHDSDASDYELDCEDNEMNTGDKELDWEDSNMDVGISEMEIDANDIDAGYNEMETGDGKIVSEGKKRDSAPAIPDGDDFVEDWTEHTAASNYVVAEETQAVDQQEDIDAFFDAITNGTTTNGSNTGNPAGNYKRVTTAIKKIRHWLDKLEAELSPVETEPPATKCKRKRTTSTPPAKRRKVNITTARARVQYDGTSEVWEYTWQRSSVGGRCWVRHRGGQREEVDGECLLVHGPNISIDVVVNTTWLPITVEWDMEKGVYQGEESIGGRILTVEETVMWDAMNGVEGTHVGFISRGRG
ncbi:hypothetical protein GQ53DRAFT_753919 [Thozetella sp. PMI_491]|nr:hypothetical protein GQ53DRAFT_753919 [Thozetella sp. PMI_491]